MVAVINLLFIIWALSKSGLHDSLGTLEDGNCDRTRKLTFWMHLAINVLSTMLLGASNYTMQCLSSPTRSEVDKAHSRGIWLDIGVPSFRNLKSLSSSRVILWWTLALSSIPLHLLYNSAVFSSLSTRQYNAFLVSENFFDGDPFNITGGEYDDVRSQQDSMQSYQRNQSMLQKLDNSACIRKYKDSINSAYADVLVVTTAVNKTNSLLEVWLGVTSELVSLGAETPTPLPYSASVDWICSGLSSIGACVDHPVQTASEWSVFGGPALKSASVQYCLSQEVPEHCKLQFSLAIMIVVVVCNVAKAACMGFIVWRNDSEPLGPIHLNHL